MVLAEDEVLVQERDRCRHEHGIGESEGYPRIADAEGIGQLIGSGPEHEGSEGYAESGPAARRELRIAGDQLARQAKDRRLRAAGDGVRPRRAPRRSDPRAPRSVLPRAPFQAHRAASRRGSSDQAKSGRELRGSARYRVGQGVGRHQRATSAARPRRSPRCRRPRAASVAPPEHGQDGEDLIHASKVRAR